MGAEEDRVKKLIFLSVLLSVVICACAGTKAAPQAGTTAAVPTSSSPRAVSEYRVKPGDRLDIKFFGNSELNEDLVVRPDGKITLQLIQEVVAAGKTPAELTVELRQKYSEFLAKPEVAVIVRSFSSHIVYVDGEVVRPGVYNLVGETSLLQTVALAGGFKDSARKAEVVIIRRDAIGNPLGFLVDAEKAVDAGELGSYTVLEPNDIVYVPKSAVANVNTFIDLYIRRNVPIPFSLGAGIY